MIFDTDILIWFMRRDPASAKFLDSVPVAERRLSAVTVLELLYGCNNSTSLKEVQKLVSDLFTEVIPLTEPITDSALQIMTRFVLSRRPGANDVLIAATALHRQEQLATANRKHFDFIPGLELRIFRP
ncbi:MAG: PIN domain-containing protein [Terriglobia bacterium]